MVNTLHFIPYILCMVLFISGSTFAEESLSPSGWLNDLMNKQGLKGEFIHRIVIVTDIKTGHANLLEINKDELTSDAFFDLIEKKELEFPFLLNKRPEERSTYTNDKNNIEEYSTELFKITYADTVIYAPKGEERWTFYRLAPDGQAHKAFAIKGPSDAGAASLKAWFIDKLGYSGFLLDHKGSYVLAAVYKPLQKGANALLASQSESQLRIKKSETKGTTLLKMIDCAQNVCVFEILIDKQEKWSQGAKVIF